MLPKADSGSFVLFSLLFVLTLTDPPRPGKRLRVKINQAGKEGETGSRRGGLSEPRARVIFLPRCGMSMRRWRGWTRLQTAFL